MFFFDVMYSLVEFLTCKEFSSLFSNEVELFASFGFHLRQFQPLALSLCSNDLDTCNGISGPSSVAVDLCCIICALSPYQQIDCVCDWKVPVVLGSTLNH